MTKPEYQLKSKDRPSDLFDRVVVILEQGQMAPKRHRLQKRHPLSGESMDVTKRK